MNTPPLPNTASPLRLHCRPRTLLARTRYLSAVGTLVLSLPHFANAQDPEPKAKDPSVAQSPVPARPASPTPSANGPSLSLTCEVFSLPIAKAAELNRRGLSDPDLYQELVQTAKLERFTVLRPQNKQEVVSESVYEKKFPTEFEKPDQASTDSKKQAEDSQKAGAPSALPENQLPLKTDFPINAAFPSAYDVRNTGDRVTVGVEISGNEVSLDIVLEYVFFLGTSKHTAWQVETPDFAVTRLHVLSSAVLGKPRLVGTLNPWFAKSSILPMETSRKEQDIWLCFVTPNRLSDTPSGQGKATR